MTFKTNGNFVWGIGAMGESGTYAVKNQEVIEYKASDLNDTEAGIKNNCLKILRENEIRIEQIYDGHKIYWKKAPSNAALKDVLENIVSQVGYPQADNDTERVSGVVYTKLCDMNRDGADELIVLSVRRGKSSTDHGSYTLEIYSTENEKEIKLFSITIDKGWGIFEIGFDYQNNIMMTYYAEDLGTTYCLFFKGTDIQYIGYTSCDDVNKPGGCKRHDHIEKSWIAEGDSLSYAMVDKDDSEYNSVYRRAKIEVYQNGKTKLLKWPAYSSDNIKGMEASEEKAEAAYDKRLKEEAVYIDWFGMTAEESMELLNEALDGLTY